MTQLKSWTVCMRVCLCSVLALLVAVAWATPWNPQFPWTTSIQFPDLYEASIMDLQAGLEKGQFTSVDLVVESVHSYCC